MSVFRSLLQQPRNVGGYILDQALIILDATNNTGSGYSSSATTWADLSGNGNDFTVSNINWTNKKCEITPYVSECYGTQITQSNNVTIEICCEIGENIGSEEKPLIADFSIGNGSIGIQNASYTNGIGMTYCDQYTTWHDYNLIDDSNFSQNTTYTFSVTIDEYGNTKGYINGVLVLDTTDTPLPVSNTLTYKAYGRESGCTLSGAISSIRVYNKVLTQQEITQNYSLDVSKFS